MAEVKFAYNGTFEDRMHGAYTYVSPEILHVHCGDLYYRVQCTYSGCEPDDMHILSIVLRDAKDKIKKTDALYFPAKKAEDMQKLNVQSREEEFPFAFMSPGNIVFVRKDLFEVAMGKIIKK